jgi:hypothetical protein
LVNYGIFELISLKEVFVSLEYNQKLFTWETEISESFRNPDKPSISLNRLESVRKIKLQFFPKL